MNIRTLLTLSAVVAGCRATVSTGPGGPPPPSPPPPVVRDHREPPPPPPPPPPHENPPPVVKAPVWDSSGWTLLGSKVVNNTKKGTDSDVIWVGKQQGRFDQITLVVLNSDIDLQQLTVVFHDATKFQPPLRHTFKEGQRTHLIALPYGDRAIDNVQLKYSNLPGGGQAKVEVWARHK